MKGHVKMSLSIDTGGHVSRIEIIDAQPSDIFTKAAKRTGLTIFKARLP
ncbi:MAG: hypothetical protein DIZ80_16790 [endosymbiont of Galathealinum brachiosum]|uniref:TonB C-terminal domain-containing protein n=1 Tax=endosymbiont of Galathealinum brachiosum TaxID=2200906 RepID=A0A370D6N4_9GAMM|nr:MAG: hypothetical protein DIZ80_16790 [endosymbiont of Galathealinum brachiosum]